MNEWFEAEKRVERAHELYESGRWEEALRELRAALRVNPDQPQWQYNLGVTLEAMGRYPEAVEAFKLALVHEGEDLELLNIIGINCARADRYEEAMAFLQRAERLDPDDPTSYVHRIETCGGMGDHDAARTMFYQALHAADEREPARAYLNIAPSLVACGEVDRALWCLKQALRIDPNIEQVHARLGDAWWAKGDHEKACASYLQHLRRDPGDGDTLLDLGNLLIEMRRPAEAAEKFRRAIELDPSNADAHFCLGQLALLADRPAAARRSLQMALRLKPDRPEVHQKLAAIALSEGDRGGARDHLAAELKADHPRRCAAATEELGRLLLDAEMPAQAVEMFEPLARAHPDDARVAHHLGVALLLVGQMTRGIRQCRRAVALDGDFTLAMHNLVVANIQRGNLRRARYWLAKARQVDPRDHRLRRLGRKLRAVTINRAIRCFLDVFTSRPTGSSRAS